MMENFVPSSTVTRVRSASRRLVRELGLLGPTLADTNLSASAVHTILEIGERGSVSARELSETLNLDASVVQRLLRRLTLSGDVEERHEEHERPLALTAEGRRKLASINEFGGQQVIAALEKVPAFDRDRIADGLCSYADALASNREGCQPALLKDVTVQKGYLPGLIGRTVEMHARFYSRTASFGSYFESKVAAGLAEFVPRLENPENGIWVAVNGEMAVGTIAVDGQDLGGSTAHLRWFIIDDGMRGAGIGRRLLKEAIAFCDHHGFQETHLWTFKGLDAARKLYEAAGFVLVEEERGSQWGTDVMEQRFVRTLP